MKSKLICLLFLIAMLFSCQKENSAMWTEVYLKVRGLKNQKPIDVDYTIEGYSSGLVGGFNVEELDAGDTFYGETQFAFKAKKRNEWRYELRLLGDVENEYMIFYNSERKQDNSFHLNKGEINNIEVQLVNFGRLDLSFFNDNCFNEWDDITFNIKHQEIDYSQGDHNIHFWGCTYGQKVNYDLPVGDYTATYNLSRNDVDSTFSDTFNIEKGEHQILNVHY